MSARPPLEPPPERLVRACGVPARGDELAGVESAEAGAVDAPLVVGVPDELVAPEDELVAPEDVAVPEDVPAPEGVTVPVLASVVALGVLAEPVAKAVLVPGVVDVGALEVGTLEVGTLEVGEAEVTVPESGVVAVADVVVRLAPGVVVVWRLVPVPVPGATPRRRRVPA